MSLASTLYFVKAVAVVRDAFVLKVSPLASSAEKFANPKARLHRLLISPEAPTSKPLLVTPLAAS